MGFYIIKSVANRDKVGLWIIIMVIKIQSNIVWKSSKH
jgi:hypothetical protein